jgi:archaellum component FlaC
MPKVNVKGSLNEVEYEKFEEIKKEVGSGINVLRLLLKRELGSGVNIEEVEENINNLKNEFEELRKHLESIDERLSVLINILSYGK